MAQKMDLGTLVERFGSDANCRAYLEGLRWPDGVRCLRCDSDKIARIETRKLYECMSCSYQFSVTVGTIFHDSKLPLWKWFAATFLVSEAKKGMSANQLKRVLGVSYKTAWYLCHRIRAAMKDDAPSLLEGVVQVDETFVGGKRPGIGQGRKDHRTIVLGAVETGGSVRLKVEKRRDRATLHAFIRDTVSDDATEIHTDSHPAYTGVGDENTKHQMVNHNVEWVRADGVHTNEIEGVWSLLKRSIIGSYHHLSVKHLPAYLDEVSFRYNNRHNEYLFRDTILKLVGANTLPYKEVITTPSYP